MKHLFRLSLLVVSLSLLGCHTYSPVTFEVRDWSTHRPVPGAQIQVGCLVYLDFFPPDAAEGTTNKDGRITLRVVHGYVKRIYVRAPGYRPTSAFLRDNGILSSVRVPDYPADAVQMIDRIDPVNGVSILPLLRQDQPATAPAHH